MARQGLAGGSEDKLVELGQRHQRQCRLHMVVAGGDREAGVAVTTLASSALRLASDASRMSRGLGRHQCRGSDSPALAALPSSPLAA